MLVKLNKWNCHQIEWYFIVFWLVSLLGSRRADQASEKNGNKTKQLNQLKTNKIVLLMKIAKGIEFQPNRSDDMTHFCFILTEPKSIDFSSQN